MTQRFTLHIILCVFFAAVGYWLYLQLYNNESELINSIFVASYWFLYLVFLFFSWFFYWVLHRRSVKSWVFAQLIALLIAVVATASVLYISRIHQSQIEAEVTLQKQESTTLQPNKDNADSAVSEEGVE